MMSWSRKDGKIVYDGIVNFDAEESDELREAFTTHGLTAEQVTVAQIEAKLEKARAEGVIRSWSANVTGRCAMPWGYFLHWDPWKCIHSDHPTRLAAAQAALARVNELRAEAEAAKAKLADPEKSLPRNADMTDAERMTELVTRGCHIAPTTVDECSAVRVSRQSYRWLVCPGHYCWEDVLGLVRGFDLA